MASQPKGSKRKRVRKFFGKLLQPGGGNVAASHPASQASASSVSLSASAQPSRPPTPPVNNQVVQAPAPSPSISGQLTVSPPTQGAALVVASTISAAGPGPTSAKLKQVGNTAWSALEGTLRVLEKSADAIPLLKSAVGEFTACLDVVQAAAESREEYKNLADELDIVAKNLKEYISQLGPDEQSPSIARLAMSIQAQVDHIKERRDLGSVDRVLQSAESKEDIIKCYRNIGSLFHQLQYTVTLQTWKNTNKVFVEMLLQKVSPADDARYNSSYSRTVKRRACTKDTRETVQADLHDWVRDPNGAKVYWMNGMAGTGKTTIAFSLCKWLESNKQLGASFFCSRVSSSCRDPSKIVPTIAYQIARYSISFRSSLCRLLESDPDAGTLDIIDQFQKLIRGPMLEVKDSMPRGVVVVIDGLDECEGAPGVRLFLQTLLESAEQLPLSFFVTSRPEPTVIDRMQSGDGCLPSVLHLHDIEQSLVEADIRKYIIEGLSSMSPPPSDEEISQLVSRAGNLFIYAATVVRYICPDDYLVDSSDRLQTMLRMEVSLVSDDEPSRKYDELNQLYTTILVSALGNHLERKEIESRRLVLWTVICLKEPLSASSLAILLSITERQVSIAVRTLASVLHKSKDTNQVSTLHASFADYMFDQLRSAHLHCDLAGHSRLLASRSFEVMRQLLRFNICELKSSALFDEDLPDLSERIETCIPPVLFYTCMNWSEHLILAPFAEDLLVQLVGFTSNRLLFWMEVLNLRRRGKTGMKVLRQAQGWLKDVANMGDIKKTTHRLPRFCDSLLL